MPGPIGGAGDPGGHARRRAARVVVVGLAVFVLLGWVADIPEAAGPAFFAVFTLGAQADFGGTPRRRALRYLVTGAIGLATLALATLLADHTALLVAATGIVVFTTLFLGTLGGPFYSARFPVVIAFLYGATTAATGDAVPQRILGWTVGALAITGASLVLWPARDLSEVPARVGDVLRRAAGVLRSPQGSPARARLLDASHRLRIAANAEHLHAGAVASDERRRAELVHATERLAAVCAVVVPRSHAAVDTALIATTAGTLVDCADDIDGAGSAGPHGPALAEALDAHAAAMATRVAVGSADPAPGAGSPAVGADADRGGGARVHTAADVIAADLTSTDVRAAARTSLAVAVLVDRQHGPGPAEAVPGDALDDHPDAALRAQLRLRSLWLRNALRAAVALCVALVLIHSGVGDDHGFWIALGAFSVLRADLVTIGRSAGSTIVGTTCGFLVSSGVVLLSEDVHGVLWASFVVALFVAALGDRVRPEVGAAAFTTLVVTLYTLVEPAGLRTGEVRLINVSIGVLVTLGVTLVLWPRPGRAPRRMVAEVVDHARASLAASIAGHRTAEPLAAIAELDRVLDVVSTSAPRTLSDAARARVLLTVELAAALAEHFDDPAPADTAPLGAVAASPRYGPALVVDAQRVDGALRALVARLSSTGSSEASRPPPPPDALVTAVTVDLEAPGPPDAALVVASTRVAAVLALVHRLACAVQAPTRTGTLE